MEEPEPIEPEEPEPIEPEEPEPVVPVPVPVSLGVVVVLPEVEPFLCFFLRVSPEVVEPVVSCELDGDIEPEDPVDPVPWLDDDPLPVPMDPEVSEPVVEEPLPIEPEDPADPVPWSDDEPLPFPMDPEVSEPVVEEPLPIEPEDPVDPVDPVDPPEPPLCAYAPAAPSASAPASTIVVRSFIRLPPPSLPRGAAVPVAARRRPAGSPWA